MLDSIKPYLIVGLGSALGGMGRLWVSTVVARHFGGTLPWGTLAVNVSGSFVIGLFVALAGPEGRWPVQYRVNLFFVSGLCGGYTTFSAFSLQTLHLAREGHWVAAGGNILFSVVFCLAAVLAGYLAGQLFNR